VFENGSFSHDFNRDTFPCLSVFCKFDLSECTFTNCSTNFILSNLSPHFLHYFDQFAIQTKMKWPRNTNWVANFQRKLLRWVSASFELWEEEYSGTRSLKRKVEVVVFDEEESREDRRKSWGENGNGRF